MENFAELNLNPAIAQAITELGFDKPTPIQAQALPLLLQGETDFLGLAATGTGKTAAFGIPLLQRIQPTEHVLQAVVLCPTRELAIQTARQLSDIGKYLGVEVPAIYGGGRFFEQRDALRTAPIIVATPGRLIDHLEQGNVSLEKITTLVLDEADEMISMGFEEALDTILAATSRELCRTWLFSATLPAHLKHVAEDFMKDPKRIHLNHKQVLSGTVQQIYYTVRERNKAKGLCKLIDWNEDFYGLIFVQTKREAQELAQFLRSRRYHVDSLHGDKEQAHRERTLAAFRTRQVNILVCTDVAARGLDVSDLTHVVNFSLPNDAESYVHRIGRTGRGGKQGVALSLVDPRQLYLIPRIEKRTKVKLEHGIFPSKKAVSARMLTRFLPRFASTAHADKAMEILDESWKATLGGMTKEEIASRFIALALPELFEEDIEEREPKKHEKKPFVKKARPARELPTPAPVQLPVAAEREPEAKPLEAPVMVESVIPAEESPIVESGLYLEAPVVTPLEPAAPLAEQEQGKAPTVTEAIVAPGAEIEAAAEAEAGEPAAKPEQAPPERRSFAKKPFGKKPFGKRPFGGKRDFEDRPFRKRELGDKPFGPRRDFGDRPFGKRRFGDKPFGPRRDFGDRPFPPRQRGFMMDGQEVFLDRKPIERKQAGSGKPFARKRKEEGVIGDVEREAREYGQRHELKSRKPFFRREEGEGGEFRPRKPFFRREEGEGRPERAFGERPFGKKPFGRKPYGASKSFGKKPFGPKGAKGRSFGAKRPFGAGRGKPTNGE